MRQRIALLGSTGSIGCQTLDVAAAHPAECEISVLAAHSRDELLEEQIRKFQPAYAVLSDEKAALRLKARYEGPTTILSGDKAIEELAASNEIDTVVTALVGFAGLKPTLAAIKAGKKIALANKETLVAAGELVTAEAKKYGVDILPVDSEHSALFQCLHGESPKEVHKLLITASGGPFRGRSREQLAKVTLQECLQHPNWSMGRKITVDSATLANKGLEVIEARWLFDVSYDQIEVVVHPQSIVHSMVEFSDSSVLAQIGYPDMRLPIQYALFYPRRLEASWQRLDWKIVRTLTFEPPDVQAFPLLATAFEVGRAGGTYPCVFNAANEVAVEAFLQGKISFLQITEIVQKVLSQYKGGSAAELASILAANDWARQAAAVCCSQAN